MGLAQAAALVPGVSRSGATITCGLFLGLRREEAARFSFLMSVPVTAAAAGLSLAEAAGAGMGGHEAAMFLAGSISSGAVGYLAIRFLLRFLADHTLRVFAYYRFALAAVVAAVHTSPRITRRIAGAMMAGTYQDAQPLTRSAARTEGPGALLPHHPNGLSPDLGESCRSDTHEVILFR